MSIDFELTLSPSFGAQQSMKVSPRLVAANYILELSSQELQQAIATELHDNPALEVVDVPTCRVCGTEMRGSICPHCIQEQKSATSLQDKLNEHNATHVPRTRVDLNNFSSPLLIDEESGNSKPTTLPPGVTVNPGADPNQSIIPGRVGPKGGPLTRKRRLTQHAILAGLGKWVLGSMGYSGEASVDYRFAKEWSRNQQDPHETSQRADERAVRGQCRNGR